MKNKPHKLFISHSSKDAEYMKAFVDLLVAIGVHKNQITCTSVPQCYIPVRCNIYDWLAKQFQTSDLHVVYAFSDNYYSSVATLNEMGAAWVMRIKHIKENRIYNHRLYEIKIQVFPEDEQKENFVVNGRHYYWMSISDMERDPNIVKKNLDVIDFVKESMHA